jgi:hypothetical protein
MSTAITATFEIPSEIAEGLANGLYERSGGIVRKVGSKQVVAWLREIPGSSLNPATVLSGLANTASILNLGISVMGFAAVLQKINHLEEQLIQAQQLMEKIDRKINLKFYANFRAALDLATNAFTMTHLDNRESMAVQAINRFSEAKHIYLGLVDEELEYGSQAIDKYLLMLSLA